MFRNGFSLMFLHFYQVTILLSYVKQMYVCAQCIFMVLLVWVFHLVMLRTTIQSKTHFC